MLSQLVSAQGPQSNTIAGPNSKPREPFQSENEQLQELEAALLNKQELKQWSSQLTSSKLQRTMMYPDLHGNWYPGYFEHFYHNGMFFKDHDTLVGIDQHLGPICISLLNNDLNEEDTFRVLVRTQYKFAGMTIQVRQKHNRSRSRSRSGRGRFGPQKTKVLDEAVTSYLECLKADQAAFCQSALTSDIINCIDIKQLVDNLVSTDFSTAAQMLLDLERFDGLQTCQVAIWETSTEQDHSKQLPIFDRRHSNATSASLNSLAASSSKSLNTLRSPEELKLKLEPVLADFLDKEQTYLDHLQLMQSSYIDPLVEMNIVSKEQLKMAMPRLTDLLELQKCMVEVLRTGVNENKLGQQMMTMVSRLDIYGRYINAYEKQCQQFRQLKQSNAEFATFIQSVDTKNISRLRFEDLVIEPIQKLPRYELVLRDVIKYTSLDDDNYTVLNDALEQYRKASKQNNDSKRDEDATVELFNIVGHVLNCPHSLVKHGRRLMKQYRTFEFDTTNNAELGDLNVYLFNDALMLTAVKKYHNKLQRKDDKIEFLAMFDLTQVNLYDLSPYGLSNCVRLETDAIKDERNTIQLGDLSLNHYTDTLPRARSSKQIPFGPIAHGFNFGKELENFSVRHLRLEPGADLIQKYRQCYDSIKQDGAKATRWTSLNERVNFMQGSQFDSKIAMLCISDTVEKQWLNDLKIPDGLEALLVVLVKNSCYRTLVLSNWQIPPQTNAILSNETWWRTDQQVEPHLLQVISNLNKIALHSKEDVNGRLLRRKRFLLNVSILLRDLNFDHGGLAQQWKPQLLTPKKIVNKFGTIVGLNRRDSRRSDHSSQTGEGESLKSASTARNSNDAVSRVRSSSPTNSMYSISGRSIMGSIRDRMLIKRPSMSSLFAGKQYLIESANNISGQGLEMKVTKSSRTNI